MEIKDTSFELYGETTLDDRNRVSLTHAIKELRRMFDIPEQIQFSISINKNGQILLSPMISIPLAELWLFKNPKALESVMRGLEQAKAGKLVTRESFAQYADDDTER